MSPWNVFQKNPTMTGVQRIIDLSSVIEQAEGDMELLSELMNAFLLEYPRSLAELEFAVRRGDFQRAHRCAQSLKGSLIAIGANAVASVVLRAESAAKQKDAEALQTAYSMLHLCSQELMQVVEHLAAASPSKYIQ